MGTYPYTFANLTTAQGAYLDANFTLIPFWGPVSTLASANTTDLGTAASACVSITGTTTISSFGSSASSANAPIYFVTFTGALTLTYNSVSMILPGAANITTAAGDSLLAEYLGAGNWKVLVYSAATGQPLVTGSAMLDAQFGSTQGMTLYRGASGWAALGPGTSGQFLKTQGAAANPIWATPAGGGNVTGPGSSTANHIAKFADASGTLLADGYAIASGATTVAALDKAGTFSAPQTPTAQALSDAATVTVAITQQLWTLTTGAARAMGAPSGGTTGTTYRLILTSQGFTPTWNTVYKFAGGTVPSSLTGTCVFDFYYDGTNYLCVGQNINIS